MSIKKPIQITLRQAALTAGLGLIIMTAFTLYPYNSIFPQLVSLGDAEATVKNLLSNGTKFRIAICSYLIVILCDVLVAWALYIFFASIGKHLSMLMAWFRIIYAIVFVVALTNYFEVLTVLGTMTNSSPSSVDYRYEEILFSIKAFDSVWALGFVFFGIHLVLLGYLAFKADYVPKIFGILLFLVGLSYLIDKFGQFLFPDSSFNVSTYVGWGELVFVVWLLLRGGLSKNTNATTKAVH